MRILATSDLHVHITAWDYYSDMPSIGFGLARTASLIAAARAEVACCLLLDNGDFLQGSLMGDVAALGQAGVHPMIAAMNALHYDAATLGNHEFSHGLPFLLENLSDAQFPVVSANVARQLGATPLDDETLVLPTVILTRMLTDERGQSRPIRIGIIGLAPPQTTQWDAQQLRGILQTRDIVQAAAAHVPKLRADGADIVIALSHSGIGSNVTSRNMENASAALAALPGIDAVIAGHTHQTFPSPEFPVETATPAIDPINGTLYGKPAIMPGFQGSHLGVIDLDVTWAADHWQVVSGHAEVRPVAKRDEAGQMTAIAPAAPAILALVEQAHKATRARALQHIGQTLVPLHSYFAMVAASPTVRLVSAAQQQHVARALADGPYARLPVVAASAPFHAGGRGGPDNYTFIPAGTLVMRHAFDLYPHPNTIAALRVTGAELVLWLERSCSQFNQIAPGAQDAELLDLDFPSFNFSALEPLTWTVDLSQPPRCDHRGKVIREHTTRIRDLAFQDAPVDPAQDFILASNSYRASGSGGFVGTTPDRIVLCGTETNRDVLLSYIAEKGTLPAPAPANWRFAPMPGTTVLFDSAPAAADFITDFAPQKVEPLHIAANGFRRFRLHL